MSLQSNTGSVSLCIAMCLVEVYGHNIIQTVVYFTGCGPLGEHCEVLCVPASFNCIVEAILLSRPSG